MLAELAGFTLSRTIPDSALLGILTGANKIYGGVVRNSSGQIIAHLVNATSPLNLASLPFQGLNAALSGVNAYQLSRIGANVSQLLTLAKGTMALSGLTLGVSAIGFIFLNGKLKNVDKRLNELKKDVTEIKNFLKLKESSEIFNALKTIEDATKKVKNNIREELLLDARQTLGQISHKYSIQLKETNNLKEILPIEEYFTITSLAYAMCSAELGMFDHAHSDIKNTFEVWKNSNVRIAKDLIIKENPERMMHPRYVKYVRTDNLIDWLNFANQSDKGIDWIDELRDKKSWIPNFTKPNIQILMEPNHEEKLKIEIMRKIVAREKILDGYVSQYEYLSKIKQKPSTVQQLIESIPKKEVVEECFILLSNDYKDAA